MKGSPETSRPKTSTPSPKKMPPPYFRLTSAMLVKSVAAKGTHERIKAPDFFKLEMKAECFEIRPERSETKNGSSSQNSSFRTVAFESLRLVSFIRIKNNDRHSERMLPS